MGSRTEACIDIVLIGAGVIGAKHAQAISDSSYANLIAIIDPSPLGSVLAEKFSTARFESVGSFLASSTRVHGAIICTPNNTHVPIAKQMASAGLHLLVEKPLSLDTVEGVSLLAHCVKHNVKVCVGHHRRQNPRILAAKQALDRSAIGQVIGCSGSWRCESGGGVVLINVIHEIDLLHSLIGRIVRVYAEQALSPRDFEAEEGVALTLKFENGVIGTFLALDNAASPFTFEQATGEFTYHPYTGQDTYRIFGRQGTLNLPQNELWTPKDLKEGWRSEWGTETIPFSEDDAFTGQLRNFIEVIEGTSPPGCSDGDGLAAVAVCEAIRTSLLEKRSVEVQHTSESEWTE